jgi:hypothetical protein
MAELFPQGFGQVGEFIWRVPIFLIKPLPDLIGAVRGLAKLGEQVIQIGMFQVVNQKLV